jgi:hypothetical protein
MTELPTHTVAGQRIAWEREETEPCQAGTAGCCVDHQPGDPETGCETW